MGRCSRKIRTDKGCIKTGIAVQAAIPYTVVKGSNGNLVMAIKTCEFRIMGKPTAKGRPRLSKLGHAYTPASTREYEVKVKQSAWIAMQTSKLQKTDRRVGVIISFLFEIPKSYSKQKRLECETGARIPGKPDIDNLAKTILDGCNDIIYGDDAAVWHLTAFKRYCDVGQEPHTQVKIQWDEPSE